MDIKAELIRLTRTATWSWQGLRACWAREKSFRQWIGAYIPSAALAFMLDLTPGERALILALGLGVIVMEIVNSAIEEVVDLITTEQDPRAGRAKDYGSAAVMLTAIGNGIAWLVILIG